MSQKAATTAVDGHQSKPGTGSKSKGRQPTKTGPVSEEELKRQQYISPEDVLRLERATEGKDRQPARCACSDPHSSRPASLARGGGVHTNNPNVSTVYRLPMFPCCQRLRYRLCEIQDQRCGVRSHTV